MYRAPKKSDVQSNNWILEALPANEYKRLAPHLEAVDLKSGQVLHQPQETISYLYFPDKSMISIVSTMAEGSSVEIGVVGREGLVGLAVLMGFQTTPNESMVQIPDGAVRIKPEALIREFKRGGDLQRLILRYTHAMMMQISQTAACNRMHTIEERLARWLLMCHDRTDGDELPLTHEFLAMMLGTRRAGVTGAAITLQTEGFIRYSRGHITVLDRQGLEEFSCECYSIVKAEFDRLRNS